MLETAYAWLDGVMADRIWAAAGAFCLADWSHRIATRFKNLIAYRARLLARPSFARAVDAARPFRAYFPLGAPDRD